MPIKKGQISNLLRSLGLMRLTDHVGFYLQKFKNRHINKDFKLRNPTVKLPPDYLLYESFQLHYEKYYQGGFDTARWLIKHLEKHISLNNKRILDWGCGPGRLIRHLPQLTGNKCEYFGTDTNQRSIEWCAQNLENIQFNKNPINAQLPYKDDFMDVIYGISILTHLSEQLQYDWSQELLRVLRPGGILFLTTQGDNFKEKLTDTELTKYLSDQVVIRGNVQVGHRTYSAFHPPGFIRHLFSNAEVAEHIRPDKTKNKSLPQDIWIVRKP
jgi:SAM-dependent methyltransferase